MKYLYLTNKWLLIINLLLFIIPYIGFMFLIVTGIFQVLIALIIAGYLTKLDVKGKTLFIVYVSFTLVILALTYITYGEKLYFDDITFIIVMLTSVLLALLHLKITHLLYKPETHETN